MNSLYHRAEFLLGVASLKQLPLDQGSEVAFAGRSNVGKSSALNLITNQKSLARTSKTPGRTQQINFFTLGDDSKRLVDLPGYGYAKVPEAVKLKWQRLLSRYLEERQSLKGIVVLMDSRRPFGELDTNMLNWCCASNVPLHVLLTKVDKLSRSDASAVLKLAQMKISETYSQYDNEQHLPSVQLFSSLKKHGVGEVHQVLDAWFNV